MIRVAAGTRLPREFALALVLDVVEQVFAQYGFDAWITSGDEGKHSIGSEHYVGHALDFRTKQLPPNLDQRIRDEIAFRLGPDFDVLRELDPPHLHVEWDRKLPASA